MLNLSRLLTLILAASSASSALAADLIWEKEVDCGYGALVIDSAEERDDSGVVHTVYQMVVRDPGAVGYLTESAEGAQKLVNPKGELITRVSAGRLGRGGCLFLSQGIQQISTGLTTYIGGALDGRGNFTVEIFEGLGIASAVERPFVNWQFHGCTFTPRRSRN